MLTNLDRYKEDLDSLLAKGDELHLAMQFECFPEQVERAVKEKFGDKTSEPTAEQVDDLVAGATKVIKTLF